MLFLLKILTSDTPPNIKGKKTDVIDCQWIQKLHALGLLSSSFLPDEDTEILRTFTRHRLNLIQQAASTSKKMQKYLRLMNIRLDVVVKAYYWTFKFLV